MIRALLITGLLASLLTACSSSTVYIVRHADRANDTDTTSLSAAGYVRARALAERLHAEPLDSVFVTDYARVRQTAMPTVSSRGVALTQYPVKPVGVIIDRLKHIRGKNVLVVGHSNTILEIAKGLGTTPSLTKIEHGDYRNLFIVSNKRTLFRKKPVLREEKYGQ